ncbi:hypothetical protein AB0K60_10335 [Thermopolyspora sp. NPDC052614]|uniref:hypothetical protein n=1 Tax=Thermopolyspora sp. NPDC052614 TaxID=3155682 RepID=UPI0034457FC1
MKRLITTFTSLAVAASTFWAAAPAQAAAQAAGAQSTAKAAAAESATARRPYVRVTFPTRVARGGLATYTVRATGLRSARGEAIVMVSYLPRHLGTVRIIQRPSNSTCGFRASKWAVYCVVFLRGQSSAQWRFRLDWNYRYAGWYRVDNYAKVVSIGGGTGWDYASQITKADLIGKPARTKILR